MEKLSFTFPEVLSFIGVIQCVYVLVYVSLRAGSIVRIILPFLYFFVLGTAFFIDLSRRHIGEITPYYDVMSWGAWTLGLPLSALLIIQMSQIRKLPPLLDWLIILVVPLAYMVSKMISAYMNIDCRNGGVCPDLMIWLNITGVIAGALSLLLIWTHRNLFSDILQQKAGKERYWLILSLIIVNIAFLALTALNSFGYNVDVDEPLLRTILGLSFVYLVSTSLFRIYPVALFTPYQKKSDNEFSTEEKELSEKIESLLKLEKIYHEPNYSRSDLAHELNVPEAMISKVINLHFKKSFPQLLNEYRVEDSKRLLLETDASIKIVSQEVGFNSLPSFNRVFKDIVGQSPSSYRKNMIK